MTPPTIELPTGQIHGLDPKRMHLVDWQAIATRMAELAGKAVVKVADPSDPYGHAERAARRRR